MENVVSTRFYGIDSTCTRPGPGGICLPNGEPSKSVNRSTLNTFSGFLRQFEFGKKAGQYLDVFNNMAKKFYIEQIFVKRRSFESKCSFFEH